MISNINLSKLTIGAVLVFGGAGSAFAAALPNSFADLVDEVSPAVVNITTTSMVDQRPGDLFPPDMPLPDMFRDFLENNPNFKGQSRPATALGSGFIIDKDGIIVTNNHVIDGADTIMVETQDGKTLQAELIGRDPKTDIAVLKVNNDTDLSFVDFGDSDASRVGDWVMAIGNPLGNGFSVSTGIISARNRSLDGSYDDFIQTDAAINRGNSGGPLFNMDGEVIGVNTLILSPNGGSIGLGFSMSSRVVENVVDQLQEFGETRRGWLGVQIQPLNEELAAAIGLKGTDGALVTDVPLDGPAATAGIKAGDVITKFGGEPVDDVRELVNLVADAEVNSEVPVEIFRPDAGEHMQINVMLGRLDEALTQVATNTAAPQVAEGEPVLGMNLVELDQATAELYNIANPGGLLIKEVDAESISGQRGIQAGDVIKEVNQKPVRTAAEFNLAIKSAADGGRNAVLLLIERKEQSIFVALPFE